MRSDPSTSQPHPAAPTPREEETPLSVDDRERIAANLQVIRRRLDQAAACGGSDAPELVAVTKSVGTAATAALLDAGIQDLAENRAPNLVQKANDLEALGHKPRWHFIGHLQRNKARRVIERAHVLHSVDSTRLAEAIVRITDELERPLEVFVEVNLTGEPEKHGHSPTALGPTLDVLAASTHVHVLGLMAMGPLASRKGASVDQVFSDARSLRDRLQAERGAPTFLDGTCRLSMGMSGDLEVAIAHGSTHVRVGSALFEGIASCHRT